MGAIWLAIFAEADRHWRVPLSSVKRISRVRHGSGAVVITGATVVPVKAPQPIVRRAARRAFQASVQTNWPWHSASISDKL
jgi:hypothetical protein